MMKFIDSQREQLLIINETDIISINVDISSLESLASVPEHLCYFFEHADMFDRLESSVLNQSLR